MKPLSNNRDLYEYLVFLAAELKKRKLEELSEAVSFASRHAASNISTEFLGEARIALDRVMNEEDGMLTAQERADLSFVVKQLDDAFNRR
jgi:hypothetical protein